MNCSSLKERNHCLRIEPSVFRSGEAVNCFEGGADHDVGKLNRWAGFRIGPRVD